MDLYTWFVFVHVAAAVALLSGSVVASPAVRAAVQRARTRQEIRAYLAIGRPLLIPEPVSALIVLATGIYLTSVAGFWSQGWIWVAVAFWVVNAAIAGVVVKPAIARISARAAESTDAAIGQDLNTIRWSTAWTRGGDALMAIDGAMLYVMTAKPGPIGSLLVVVAAGAIVAAVRVIRHITHTETVPPGIHQYQ